VFSGSKTVAGPNYWTPRESAKYQIVAMNEPAIHIPHGVPTEVMYKEATGALEIRYGDHQLEKPFHSQLKRTQFIGESLQEFAAAIGHMSRRGHFELPEHLLVNKPPVHSPTG
jgi:hypothetical protein